MATNHTENYQLNLWEPGDSFLRTEFNENTQKIDAALKKHDDTLTRLVIGSYKGTGGHGQDHPNTLEVPDAERPPRLIIISQEQEIKRAILVRGTTGVYTYEAGSLAHPIYVTWTDKGISWYGTVAESDQLNTAGAWYHYAIFI